MEHRILSLRKSCVYLSAFSICAFFIGCTKKQDTSEKVLKRQLRFSKSAFESPFLEFFWKELAHPSFLFAKDVHWSCADREQILIIEWNRQKTLCKDLETSLSPDKMGECLYEKKRKIPIESCEKATIEKVLSSFRLSAFDALYQNNQAPTSPNPALELENKWHLPRLELGPEASADIEYPQLQEWMAASAEQNLVSLNLENTSTANESQWQAFLNWYSTLDGPLKLNFRFPKTPSANFNKAAITTGVLPKLIFKQDLPLGREACSYLEQWFRSRLLIQGKRLENLPKMELECRLDISSPTSGNILEITRLPIPLISSIDRQFPFATRENVLDERIWNTLGALKPKD